MTYKAVIGDIHGHVSILQKLWSKIDGPFIQIGDLGIGFPGDKGDKFEAFPRGGKFIRGNHDNPCDARMHPSYLGEYGVTEGEIFYVSGACSPDFDRLHRNPGIDWWEEEQLSYADLCRMLELYADTKPRVVVTHDAPFRFYGALLGGTTVRNSGWKGDPNSNRTAKAFDEMMDAHMPDFWYFGHWHMRWAMKHENTWFRCVDINEVVNIGELDTFYQI